MANRHVRWLFKQLPGLEEKGVLSGEAAAAIRNHYRQSDRGPGLHLGLVICGILGALLIGGGIILIIANNWRSLSRADRTVIAFAPLVLAHVIALWSTATGRTGDAWREGCGIFMTLSVAAAIAIIGQTYNFPGNLKNFLFVWMLLTLPVVYLLQSAGTGVIYLAGITTWACYAQAIGGQAILFWGLLALILPFAWQLSRSERYAARTAVVGWALAVCLCVAAGVTLEKVVPGLWIVVYAALFAILYLVGGHWFSDAPSDWQKPYFVTGAAGIAGLALVLTYETPWRQIGWRHFRDAYRFHETVAWFDYAAAIVLPAIAMGLLVTVVRRGETGRILYGIVPIPAIMGLLGALRGWPVAGQMAMFNIYMFALGAGTISAGIRQNRMAVVNGGMVVLTALILARFFDSDLGLVARGLAFIVIGIGFLSANAFLHRKIKGGANA